MSLYERSPMMFKPLFGPFRWAGRSPRGEFWRFLAVAAVLGGVACYLGTVSVATKSRVALAAACALGVFGYLTLLAVTIRRLHDSDLSGWWVLLAVAACAAFLIPGGFSVGGGIFVRNGFAVCGGMWFLFAVAFMFRRGTKGTNRFGPNPADKTVPCASASEPGEALICGGCREIAGGFLDAVLGTVAFASVTFLLSFGFVVHAYTVYVAARMSENGFLATALSLCLPLLAEIYWFIRLLLAEGLYNTYTILILVFCGCLFALALCIAIQKRRGGD